MFEQIVKVVSAKNQALLLILLNFKSNFYSINLNKPRALIIGITGQDGSYLAYLLLKKGYAVYGTSRDPLNTNKSNLERLGIKEKITLLTTSINDFRSLIISLENSNPSLVFHLAGQTSVGLSFKLPFEAVDSIAISTLNLLEAVRFFNKEIKIFIPCSSECYGLTTESNPGIENSPHNPMSPYGVAKSSSYYLAKNYRNSYEMFISVGFLSNHESPLRGKHFVTSKLINSINKIKKNEINEVYFGDTSIIRDWGWAPSYVEAIYKIISLNKPDDFIVATGKSYTLNYFIERAFYLSGLGSSSKYVKIKNNEIRPNEIKSTYLNPKKAKEILGWENRYELDTIITKLINNELF